MGLKDILPAAKSSSFSFYDHSKDPWFKERFSSSSSSESQHSAVIKPNPVPPYGKRSGFVPRRLEDFGDGGAFPEIHVAQYPLGMGRKPEKPCSKILPLTVDSQGKVSFDPIMKQYENAYKIVYSQHKDLVPKVVSEDDQQAEEMEKEIQETTARTKAALEKIVNVRSKSLHMPKEKDRKEQELRALARIGSIGEDCNCSSSSVPHLHLHGKKRKETREEREQRLQHEKIREERRRERERERRLEAKDAAMGKKSKITRDRDRDISEKVALGMANTGAGCAGEVMYDQRLFNQDKGMESGFADDDRYNIYDKGLFTTQPTLSTLYHPKKDADSDLYGGADEQLEKVLKTERFKPYKAFTGTSDRPNKRDRPVEFDKEEKETDPFGLDQFFTEVQRGKKALVVEP
ncbi:hypothetical protein J5N97_001520 [Dioscorea zingiberensis]|uniref:SKI-interacting protein SKIP SNW domain-containing protein n=1 Tax=Dioscorea zingiberensis TaxID=325984 RepID=A0A9D5BU06_9LILI|nr:hypothetical protein J5N97_001520 [Dioscorea zingiberensis]